MKAEGTIDGILSELDDLEARRKAANKLVAEAVVKDFGQGLRAGLLCWVSAIVVAFFTFLYMKLFDDRTFLNSPLVDYALYFGLFMGGLGLVLMLFGSSIFGSSSKVPDRNSANLDLHEVNLCRTFLRGLKDHVQEKANATFSLVQDESKLASSEGRVKNYESRAVTFSSSLKGEVLIDLSLMVRVKRVQETNALLKRLGRGLIQVPLQLLVQHNNSNNRHRARNKVPWMPTARYDFHLSSAIDLRLVSKNYLNEDATSEILQKIVQEKLQPAFPDGELDPAAFGNVVKISIAFPAALHPAQPYPPRWDASHDIARLLELTDLLAGSRLVQWEASEPAISPTSFS